MWVLADLNRRQTCSLTSFAARDCQGSNLYRVTVLPLTDSFAGASGR
jgi:hypothetical protein